MRNMKNNASAGNSDSALTEIFSFSNVSCLADGETSLGTFSGLDKLYSIALFALKVTVNNTIESIYQNSSLTLKIGNNRSILNYIGSSQQSFTIPAKSYYSFGLFGSNATKGAIISNPYYSTNSQTVGSVVGVQSESPSVKVSFIGDFTGSNVTVSAKGYSLI